MGKKKYKVESDFEDLRGNPEDAPDLDVDLNDSDNPIINAALSDVDDNWKPPSNGDDKDENDDDDLGNIDDDGGDEDDLDEIDSDSYEEVDEDDSEDDEDEEEDDKYSKRVQKRIDRERDLRQADRADSDARIAKLERRIELRDAKDELAKEKREAEVKLRSLRKEKLAAKEDGNSEEEIDVDDKILDIKADLKAKEIGLSQQIKDLENDDGDAASPATTAPLAGQKWLGKYPEFHTNSQFKKVVLSADRMVADRGFDKNTDKYYAAMEDILRPQFPSIIKKKAATKTKRKGSKRSAVGSTTKAGTRRSGRTRTRRGVVRLTKADQEQMEVFGMDPKNPDHIKNWAENKAGD